jgi:hypothetical protein
MRACSLLVTGALAAAWPAEARELWGDGERALSLRTSLKASALVSRAPDDPQLFPEQVTGASLWRFRLELEGRPGPAVTAAVAYEQRLQTSTPSAGAAGVAILPPEAPAPFRVTQLDWSLAQGTGLAWRQEIDRAFAALHLSGAEVTVGRQAIGWGRGVLFGAVDLFAPFTPLEADREWRRGVDAVRTDVRLGDRFSIDGVAAFGERADASAFVGRLRGYAGRIDGELVLGSRAGDLVVGGTTSMAVGDAEAHGELAFFRAREALPAGGVLGDDRLAVKAVAGASYRFALGKGLTVVAEYHFSSFGAARAQDLGALLADPRFVSRIVRGDTQILVRRAAAAVASYECSEDFAVTLLLLGSPDGSGIASPSATLTLSDRLSLLTSVYFPFGAAPVGPQLRSAYGAAPLSGLLQVRIYD